MKDLLAALGSMAVAAAGLLSIVSFSIAMLATGQFGWLIVGWIALPVTVLVLAGAAGCLVGGLVLRRDHNRWRDGGQRFVTDGTRSGP